MIIRSEAWASPPDRYPWCSYSEYASGASTYADIDSLLDMLGGVQGFTAFSLQEDPEPYRPAFRKYADADEREQVAHSVFDAFGCTATSVKELPKETRDRVLSALCDGGISIAHIQRLTGIGNGRSARPSAESRDAQATAPPNRPLRLVPVPNPRARAASQISACP